MSSLDLTGLAAARGPLVTRFAPSPTGYLHLGHVVNAIYVWGLARRLGARVLLRIEDHDRVRCRPVFETACVDDLAWLGLVPDDGLHPLARQQDRDARYQQALDTLRRRHHVYTCRCSRRDIGGGPYPGTCRTRGLSPADSLALRVEFDQGEEAFVDVALGPQTERPAEQCGDLLIRDRDGHWTYQFAVTVDDYLDGVTLVIRGADLLDSTGRQLKLARMLGRTTPPVFLHHPLLLGPTGEKLSKSDGATGIRELRAAGMRPEQVIGLAARLAGLNPEGVPVKAAEISRFWDRI